MFAWKVLSRRIKMHHARTHVKTGVGVTGTIRVGGYIDVPHFRCPFILSFRILFSLVTSQPHRMVATFNLLSCAFYNAHHAIALPGLTTVLYTLPLTFTFIFLSRNTPYPLLQFFHLFWTLWVTSASSYPFSVIADTMYANVFTPFTLCKWIYAS